MKPTLSLVFGSLSLLLPLAASADGLPPNTGIYLQESELGRGDASYASSDSVSIYSNGGPTTSDNGLGTYHVTQTPTALGALSGTLASFNADGDKGSNNASLTANADLAAANVGGSVMTNGRGVTTALISDMVTFHVAGGGSADIGIGMNLDGTISGSADGADSVYFQLAINFQDVIASTYTQNGTASPNYVSVGSAFTNAQSSFTGTTGFDFAGNYLVSDGEVDRFQLRLSLDCSGTDVDCSFVDGGHLRLDLPDGVTMTSGSGVFATSTSAVPEPASAALMLAGFVAVAGVATRRRRYANGSTAAVG